MKTVTKEPANTISLDEVMAKIKNGEGVFVETDNGAAWVLTFDKNGWHSKSMSGMISWKTEGPIENIFERFKNENLCQSYFFESVKEFEAYSKKMGWK